MHAPSSPPTNAPARWFLAFVIIIFTAASSVPTPMYQLYQQNWHFSPTMLTLVFAIYVLTLLISLLVFGSSSDFVGRKPVIFAALIIEIAAMTLFITAENLTMLLIARAVQGFATGLATAALGAALFDNDHHKGPITNSIAPLLGLASGAVIAGVLVEYAPMPLHLSYIGLMLLMIVLALFLWGLPETAARRPGVLRSLTPRVFVPPAARSTMLEIAPANGSAWALGGFYLSLAPSVIASATNAPPSLSGGIAVACLMLSGAVSVLFAQKRQPADALLAGTFIQTLGIAVSIGNALAFSSRVTSGRVWLWCQLPWIGQNPITPRAAARTRWPDGGVLRDVLSVILYSGTAGRQDGIRLRPCQNSRRIWHRPCIRDVAGTDTANTQAPAPPGNCGQYLT